MPVTIALKRVRSPDVPEENLYLRYEDTIVVTDTGFENFTDFLPMELDDMERLVLERASCRSAAHTGGRHSEAAVEDREPVTCPCLLLPASARRTLAPRHSLS